MELRTFQCHFRFLYPLGHVCHSYAVQLFGQPYLFFNQSSLPYRQLTYPVLKALLKMIFLFPRWDMLVPKGSPLVANMKSPPSWMPGCNGWGTMILVKSYRKPDLKPQKVAFWKGTCVCFREI